MGRIKTRGFAALEVVLVLGVLVVLSLVGWRVIRGGLSKAGGNKQPAAAVQQQARTLKGVSLSPKSFNGADFTAFLNEAAKDGSIMTWGGNWTMLENSGSAPFTVAKLAKQYGYQPVIIVGTDTYAPEQKGSFVASLETFATAYKPAYIGIGNEVNRLHAKSPQDYAVFQQWFAEAAAAVKRASPSTQVFTTFQYEQLNGLNGGLFGGKNDPGTAAWQLLDDFPAADLVAFTTYPYIIYPDPASIPADYYSRVKSHTSKPVAFTEIGWPSGTEAAGYESTPAEQANFIPRFAELTQGLHPRFVIWPFLYGQNLPKPFTSINLIDGSGSPKPSLDVWRSANFN